MKSGFRLKDGSNRIRKAACSNCGIITFFWDVLPPHCPHCETKWGTYRNTHVPAQNPLKEFRARCARKTEATNAG